MYRRNSYRQNRAQRFSHRTARIPPELLKDAVTPEVRIEFSPPAGAAVPALPESVPTPRKISDTRYEIILTTQAIDPVIDALRAAGCSIAAIAPRKESLEDVFFTLIKEQESHESR